MPCGPAHVRKLVPSGYVLLHKIFMRARMIIGQHPLPKLVNRSAPFHACVLAHLHYHFRISTHSLWPLALVWNNGPPNKETRSNQDSQNKVSETRTLYHSVHYCGTTIPISLTHRGTSAEPPMPDLIDTKHTTELVTRYVCQIEVDGETFLVVPTWALNCMYVHVSF